MHRQALRRATFSSSAIPSRSSLPRNGQRFASTFTGRAVKRTRSAIVRWGLAGAAVYYYNTAAAFAEEPKYAVHAPAEVSRESEAYPTIDTIADQRRAQARASPAVAAPTPELDGVDGASAAVETPEDLEEEAAQQGAFNEETGEINWDCPCLGGMADGPCGEQFKAAFSCFVFSKEEPKGVDCIEHFKTMQNCFREHPDVYGAELADPEDPEAGEIESVPVSASETEPGPAHAVQVAREKIDEKVEGAADAISSDASKLKREVEAVGSTVAAPSQRDVHSPPSKSSPGEDNLVPKAWHDSTSDNKGTEK